MYSNDLICDILIYINNNLDYKINISDLEKRFFYNRFYIMKLFKKEIGITIIEYINSLRIYNSINDIRFHNNNLINIALNNGFHSLEYFSEIFKQITKLNPKTYKDYFHSKKYITDNTLYLIQNSLVNLYNVSQIKTNYLNNRKTSTKKVKFLSIFK